MHSSHISSKVDGFGMTPLFPGDFRQRDVINGGSGCMDILSLLEGGMVSSSAMTATIRNSIWE